MVIVNHAADPLHAAPSRPERRLSVPFQMEALMQEILGPLCGFDQAPLVGVHQYPVIHVPGIAPDLQLPLDELIQRVQV